ncbi:FMN-binding protein [Nocardioides zeae]|uniref:FMN-binding protein n=1 Tax=Nocardioides zeae TaxID=1457234 RepID=A0A6P0HM78_9ACTN|nr:FMN-binding protein [Nocardioides zeae]NEN78735.1 FMN-binding protein [Nocardioides zeae]
MSSHSPARRWLVTAAAVATLSLTAACGVGQSSDESSSDGSSDAGSSSSSQESTGSSDASDGSGSESGSFTAGTYDAEGGYTSPGGQQSVGVEVTLDADGTVTDVEVTPEASDSTSERYQSQFAGGIADEVVGKRIDELDVSTVAGSSLTSGGFNDAIDDIISQARA